MGGDSFTIFGGRRSGGQTYALLRRDEEIQRLNEMLAETASERDRFADQIAQVMVTNDIRTMEKVIRIRYADLADESAVIDAILIQLKNLFK